MSLPVELWEEILLRAGPLGLCVWTHVDARRIAAMRVQRAWRRVASRPLVVGAPVLVRLSGGAAWRRGTLCLWDDEFHCVRIAGKKASFLFLPHPTARVWPL